MYIISQHLLFELQTPTAEIRLHFQGYVPCLLWLFIYHHAWIHIEDKRHSVYTGIRNVHIQMISKKYSVD